MHLFVTAEAAYFKVLGKIFIKSLQIARTTLKGALSKKASAMPYRPDARTVEFSTFLMYFVLSRSGWALLTPMDEIQPGPFLSLSTQEEASRITLAAFVTPKPCNECTVNIYPPV